MLEENIENITKSDRNFAPTFNDHNLLPEINFKGQCLIKNIYVPKKVSNLYISYTLSKSIVKKFKHRFYIKELIIWICKVN